MLVVGDEILKGKVSDTNTHEAATQLAFASACSEWACSWWAMRS